MFEDVIGNVYVGDDIDIFLDIIRNQSISNITKYMVLPMMLPDRSIQRKFVKELNHKVNLIDISCRPIFRCIDLSGNIIGNTIYFVIFDI
jgi:phosphosulfolactate synthase (CoM biosynthesis protein A)